MIRDPSDGSVKRWCQMCGRQDDLATEDTGAVYCGVCVLALAQPVEASGKPASGLAALKAKYGDNWGIEPPSKPERQTYRVLTADELSAYYRENPERIVRLMGKQDVIE